MDRRQIFFNYHETEVKPHETFIIEKYSNVYTSRDRDLSIENPSLDTLKDISLSQLKEIATLDYSDLLSAHVNKWDEQVWNTAPINITSTMTTIN